MVSILEKYIEMANPHFEVNATPQRMPSFFHSIKESKNNISFSKWLSNQGSETLYTCQKGILKLYTDALIFSDESEDFPVKFIYMFNHIRFKGKPAIKEKYIWRHPSLNLKIENESLTSYCLFRILLPLYKVVISADEHTLGGEKLTRKHIETALSKNLFVYIVDGKAKIYPVDNFDQIELNREQIWGDEEFFKQMLIAYSLIDLDREKVLSALKKIVENETNS